VEEGFGGWFRGGGGLYLKVDESLVVGLHVEEGYI
jgi:hypothetical protein